MRLRFDDDQLFRLWSDPKFVWRRFGPDVTKAFRKKLGLLQAATDQRDIRAMKSSHLEKLGAARAGQHSIRLNDQWRLIVRFEDDDEGPLIAILEITDYH